MNENKDINNIIIQYLENSISEEDKVYLKNWLLISKENKQYFNQIHNAWEASFMFQPNVVIKSEFAQSFLKYNRKKLIPLYYKISGIVAILIVCILTATVISQKNKPREIIVFSENTKKEILLPDSTKVWLNINSSLKYPSKFNKSNREVTLIGEGFFDVVKNNHAPFSVYTAQMKIKVLGTRFFVNESSLSDNIEAVLEAGKISLQINNASEEYILEPNDKFCYDKTTNQINISKVDSKNYSNWINKRLVLENTRLQDVFLQLEKWFNVEIRVEKTSINDTPISFIIDKETLEEVLNTLKLIVPFEYVIIKNNIIIK